MKNEEIPVETPVETPVEVKIIPRNNILVKGNNPLAR